jgi:amino acid permease
MITKEKSGMSLIGLLISKVVTEVRFNKLDILKATSEIEDIINKKWIQEQSISFARFRDEYKRRERYHTQIAYKEAGGIFTHYSASDEKIYQAFVSGMQLSNPYEKKQVNTD